MNPQSSDICIIKRPSETRGQTNYDWLQSRHTFSFGGFYDPEYIGFRGLRIINEDIIDSKNGFGMHPHHSMEIFSYVVSGMLLQEDSSGKQRKCEKGSFHYLSAGSGVMHCEINPSETERLHFLQFWLEPDTPGGSPRYSEIDPGIQREDDNGLVLLASGDGRDDSIEIRQKSNIWYGKVLQNGSCKIEPNSDGRNFWIQMIEGDVELSESGKFLLAGDGAAVSSINGFSVTALEESEFIVFEL